MKPKYERVSNEVTVYRKIVSELPEIKVFDRGCKFGSALLISSLSKWCDELNSEGIDSLTPTELKNVLQNTLAHDDETVTYLKQLQSEESK